jgi:magnesium chelatase family protein
VLTNLISCTIVGVDAVLVNVDVDVSPAPSSYHVAGLPSKQVKEGLERLRMALETLGVGMPQANITVCLAPLDLKKQGCSFDLPILLGLLGADPRFSLDAFAGLLVLGAVGPSGALCSVTGALPAAMLARASGLRGVLVPKANAHEAVSVDGIEVYCAEHVSEILDTLERKLPLPLGEPYPRVAWSHDLNEPDVRGQGMARSALEISAAGGHNVLMVGGPGSAKGQLARSISTFLPAMTNDEALETTKVYSAVGQAARGLLSERPFRIPHHTISTAALVGGGAMPRPGEVSLAHNGVLCLEELQEFSRGAIESLLEPLQEQTRTVSRGNVRVVLPASFLLVATANPCPCGWLDSGSRECSCSDTSINRYRAKMSVPLLDQIDLEVFLRTKGLADNRRPTSSDPSAVVRARVAKARALQQKRLEPWRIRSNAEMSMAAIQATCTLDSKGEAALAEISELSGTRTGRSISRILRVARTIADLKDQDAIDVACLLEASNYGLTGASRPVSSAADAGASCRDEKERFAILALPPLARSSPAGASARFVQQRPVPPLAMRECNFGDHPMKATQ